MLHKQSPRPGAFWAPGAGGGRHDLAGSKPEQGQQAVPQAEEEAAPAHDPNQKTARPRSDMLQGLAVIFYGKNHAFRALRRLFFYLCGDHDDAHRCRLSIVMGHSTKCSAYVADICGFLACRLICNLIVFAQDLIHRMISLSGCSNLIGKN